MSAATGGTLAEFLHACRSRLGPDDVGLAVPGERRRVPGLRREEIALLAGVSASYYTRLEQGQVTGASDQVVSALGRALQLNPIEREHLHALARPVPCGDSGDSLEESVHPDLAAVLEEVRRTPALVVGRRRDILAWNPAGHALFAGHLDPGVPDDPTTRPNATTLVFLDAPTRDLYPDWEDKATASVGHLRLLAGRFPHDRRLHELVGRLTVRSAEFAQLWARNQVRGTTSSVYRMRHPLVGDLTVRQQSLTAADVPGQTLIVCTAAQDSSSAHALRLLEQLSCESEPRVAGRSAEPDGRNSRS